jgi:hypothetical protein
MERHLDCRACQTSFEKGNAATAEGLTVYDGVDPEDFQCRDCPLRISGPLDETSLMALAVWNAITPLPEGTTTIEAVFRMFEIPYPSRQAREIYHRVCLIGSIGHDITAQKQKRPKEAESQDLLAGTSFGDDDEDE